GRAERPLPRRDPARVPDHQAPGAARRLRDSGRAPGLRAGARGPARGAARRGVGRDGPDPAARRARLRGMTASLPAQVPAGLHRCITTEFTTLDSSGQPITWPVTPYYRPGDGAIDVCTGVGYPKKADDAAANPHVALLFSDPTGSGLDDAPMVLVQGTAKVDD